MQTEDHFKILSSKILFSCRLYRPQTVSMLLALKEGAWCQEFIAKSVTAQYSTVGCAIRKPPSCNHGIKNFDLPYLHRNHSCLVDFDCLLKKYDWFRSLHKYDNYNGVQTKQNNYCYSMPYHSQDLVSNELPCYCASYP